MYVKITMTLRGYSLSVGLRFSLRYPGIVYFIQYLIATFLNDNALEHKINDYVEFRLYSNSVTQ